MRLLLRSLKPLHALSMRPGPPQCLQRQIQGLLFSACGACRGKFKGCCSVHVGIKSHSEHTQSRALLTVAFQADSEDTQSRALLTVAFQAKRAIKQPQLGVTAHSARAQLASDISKTFCYSTAFFASFGVPLHRPLCSTSHMHKPMQSLCLVVK